MKVLRLIGKLEPSARQLGYITFLKYSLFLFHQLNNKEYMMLPSFYLGQSIFILIL